MSDTYHCEECGEEFNSTRKNVKLCRVCRLCSNVIFIADRTYECWACGSKFSPLERNDKFCGNCNFVRSVHDTKGKCVFCKNANDQLLHKDVKVCRSCASNPELRQPFVRALHKKQNQLRERNADAA